jgi:hypothetical protein
MLQIISQITKLSKSNLALVALNLKILREGNQSTGYPLQQVKNSFSKMMLPNLTPHQSLL